MNARCRKILLVDDDPDDRMLVKEAVAESQLRAELDTVEDGEQMMDYLHRRGRYSKASDAPRPGLILLDLNMPRKDGHEALAEIKADPELRNIVVTPIAPYLTVIKSLVLPDDSNVDLHIDTDDEAYVTADGQSSAALKDGDTIRITIAPFACKFARVQDRAYFFSTLVGRLRRAD